MFTNDSVMAVSPSTLDMLQSYALAARRRPPTARQISQAAAAQAKTLRAVKGQIAVVPCYGFVEQRASMWSYYFGGVSTDLLAQTVQALVDSREVEAIVLDWDSPGGCVSGVQEASDVIYGLRGKKQIVSIANSMAASAGFWLPTAADQFYATPGALVGSVGVYIMHVDYSDQLEQMGVKVEFIKAGKFKAEGSAYEPLSDDARDHLQELVDDTYTAFVKAVARNRATKAADVEKNYGQGRTLTTAAAVAAGMVDKMATLGQVLEKLSGSKGKGSNAAAAASADILRLRQEHRKRLAATL